MGMPVKGNINTPMFELPSETEVKYTRSIPPADQQTAAFPRKKGNVGMRETGRGWSRKLPGGGPWGASRAAASASALLLCAPQAYSAASWVSPGEEL